MTWNAARTSAGDPWDRSPAEIETVEATISVKTNKSFRAYAINPDGTRGQELPVTREKDRSKVQIGPARTLWYELVSSQ